jgi:hypothetical protein
MENTGVRVQFYGLEISKGLFDPAVRRLPAFSSRLFHGNALYWTPPLKFDYVHTMILTDIGFRPTGYRERTFVGRPYRCKRLVWIDRR